MIARANARSGGPFFTQYPSTDTTVNFGTLRSPASTEPGSADGRNCLLLGQIDLALTFTGFITGDNFQNSVFNTTKPGQCPNPNPGLPVPFNNNQVQLFPIAEDGIVPIVNTSSHGMPSTISRDYLADIYGCQITTWNQVNAASTATIVVQPRENTAGTYDRINALINLPHGAEQACMGDSTYYHANAGGGRLTDAAGTEVLPADGSTITYPVYYRGPHGGSIIFTINAKNPNAAPRMIANQDVVTRVANTPNIIGYVSLGYVNSSITALQVENIAASISTVQHCDTGTSPCYPLSSKLYMANLEYGVNGARADNYARSLDFIDQVLSPEGQVAVVQNLGLVPLSQTTRLLDPDVNMDGIVDISDLALIGLSGTWSTSTGHAHWVRADVNRDGLVDIGDLGTIGIAANWNHTWTMPVSATTECNTSADDMEGDTEECGQPQPTPNDAQSQATRLADCLARGSIQKRNQTPSDPNRYDRIEGHGLYVLFDSTTRQIRYVGRGNVNDRIPYWQRVIRNSQPNDRFHGLGTFVIADNNLCYEEGRGTEDKLLEKGPLEKLLNWIRGISVTNMKRAFYRAAAEQGVLSDAL